MLFTEHTITAYEGKHRLCCAFISHIKSEKGITSQKYHSLMKAWHLGQCVSGQLMDSHLRWLSSHYFCPVDTKQLIAFPLPQSLFWVLGEALGSVLCNHPGCVVWLFLGKSSESPKRKLTAENTQYPDAHHGKTEAKSSDVMVVFLRVCQTWKIIKTQAQNR